MSPRQINRKYQSGEKEVANGKSHSEFAVKCFTNYQDKLFNLVLYKIAVNCVLPNAEKFGKKADIKLQLVPRGAGQAIFLHSSMEADDTLGLKLLNGTYKGEPVYVVSTRQKLKASQIEKRRELLGGERFICGKEHGVDIYSLKSSLEAFVRDTTQPFEKREAMDDILRIVKSEEMGRNDLLLHACGNSQENVRQVKAAFKSIRRLTGEIAKVEENMVEDHKQMDDSMSVGRIVGAVNAWPFSAKDAALISSLPKFDSMSDPDKDFISSWLETYALNVFPKTFGVELLEHTAKNAIDDFHNLLDIVNGKGPYRESQAKRTKIFHNEFYALQGMIDKVDAEILKMKSSWGQEIGIPEWFSKLCSLTEKRKEILQKLRGIEAGVKEFSHEDPTQKQMVLTLANMAANLCRVQPEELGMLKQFATRKDLQKALSKTAEGRALQKRVADFIKASDAEIAGINGMISSVCDRKTHFKAQKGALDNELLAIMRGLEGASPAISQRLLLAFNDSKSHDRYKQGEKLSSSPGDAYFSRIMMLPLLMEQYDVGTYAEKQERYLKQNAHLYATISKNGKIRDEIMADMQPLLYAKTKGFDVEAETESLRKNNYRHTTLQANYWLSVKPGAGENRNILNIQLMDGQYYAGHFEIELHGPLPFEKGYSPPAPSNTKKKLDEEIYGRKFDLSDVVPGWDESEPPNSLYKQLAAMAGQGQKFAKVKEDLLAMNMENAHFLSTLADTELKGGCVTSMFGRNLPRRLNENSVNSFKASLLENYPNYEREAQETKDYVRHKIASRIFQMLNANLPYYVKRYVDLLQKDASSS